MTWFYTCILKVKIFWEIAIGVYQKIKSQALAWITGKTDLLLTDMLTTQVKRMYGWDHEFKFE